MGLVDKNSDLQEFKSEGYNPYFVDVDYIQESLLKALPQTINPAFVEKIHSMELAFMVNTKP